MMQQGLRVLRLALPLPEDASLHTAIVRKQEQIMQHFITQLAATGLNGSPPEVLRSLYNHVRTQTNCQDPYAEEKRLANQRAMELLPTLREKVAQSVNPLQAALHISVIGNYLDAGTGITFDWEGALTSECATVLENNASFAEFDALAQSNARILIIGDNCGEIVFDTLVVRELCKRGCHVTYAVRDVPVLNDATLDDADEVGMTSLCRVISSGCDTPGTIMHLCSPIFTTYMQRVDLILAKGQGNFEGMNEDVPHAFYAFKAKCPVIAKVLNVPQGTTMFRRGATAC